MLASLPLIFIGVSVLFAIFLIAVRLLRPGFGYSWLITAFGALIVWTLILFSRINLPQTVTLGNWSLPGFSSLRANLVLDSLSWPFVFAIGTLLLSVVLTDIARAQESDWSAWTASLSLTALGLLAVLAGNLFTLILAWAALDFAEMLVMFWHVRASEGRRRVALTVSAKIVSLFLLLWAWILAGQSGSNASFVDLPVQASLYLLLAAWIRVGVVPINTPQMQEQSVQRSLGTLLRLISAAAGLLLFAQVSRLGVVDWQAPYLIALAVIAALYGGISWMYTKDDLTSHAYWIIGVAALAMASAVSGQESASIAWGLGGLLSGGVLFLYSVHGRWLAILPALGLLQMTGLPLTQTWNGAALFGSVWWYFTVLLVIGQAFLLAGHYLRWGALKPIKPDAERWVVVIYVWGLGLIVLAQFVLAFSGNILDGSWVTPITLASIVPGIAACAAAVFLSFLQRRGIGLPGRWVSLMGSFFSLHWLYRLAGKAFGLVGRGVALATVILEGEGGILWALLWLILLMALIVQGVIRGA
jgi:formate hydrogenlyase subunit 3/multisubunit Na+/H+ antiporter MnhD subunit